MDGILPERQAKNTYFPKTHLPVASLYSLLILDLYESRLLCMHTATDNSNHISLTSLSLTRVDATAKIRIQLRSVQIHFLANVSFKSSHDTMFGKANNT